jgi:hypothetical protein
MRSRGLGRRSCRALWARQGNVQQTVYVISHIRRRMYDHIAYAVIGPTYDVVGQDVRHRR